uniref:Probable 6-phosphogluconolactonase 5, chloroplastic n=1 Tax=Nicotiana tabacum TaxID=4097 RepID=A0A1S3YGB7_TOBAC
MSRYSSTLANKSSSTLSSFCALRLASSSRALAANLRISPTQFSPLRRSLPLTSAYIIGKPLFCSRSHRRISVLSRNSSRSQFRIKSSMAETVTGKSKGKVEVFDTEEELAVSLAKYTADLSEKFCKERGSFSVVVSGGSLIKSLRKLVEPPYIDSIDWSKWHVFWVDERVVPKDHPDSNYLLAYDAFLSKIPIPSGNVYAINDALSAEGATDDYETCLRHLVK